MIDRFMCDNETAAASEQEKLERAKRQFAGGRVPSRNAQGCDECGWSFGPPFTLDYGLHRHGRSSKTELPQDADYQGAAKNGEGAAVGRESPIDQHGLAK